ncbi:hypothetical protein [Legionella saoudiensis]|uniref:hypothetical protein n=1 Tax=Legionella saoudiensis TaxID=1750561 RepID=UPI00072FFB70|nr:hypothetical protein [Legionella saoudiensis]
MAKVRKLTGNYVDILKVMYPVMPFYPTEEGHVENYTSPSSDLTGQLLLDLDRDQYVSTNDRSFDEFVATWMNPATSVAYNQGNLTASFFSMLLGFYIQLEPRFEEHETAEGAPDRIQDRLTYVHRDNKRDIGLAYFDDNGVPCGISIDYSILDPNLWTISIIRNTTAAPEERQVFLLSSAEILDLGKKGLVSTNEAQKALFDFLKSKTLAQQIKDCGLFTQDGKLNLDNLDKLHAKYHTGKYPYDTAVVDKLEKQKKKVKTWDLTKQQFSHVKAALVEKRQKNIEQLNEWYAQWHTKQINSVTDPVLDTVSKQSFWRRNSSSIFAAVAAVVTLIGFALVLSGVLAPLGIALVGTTELILGAVGAGLALTATITSATQIGLNEHRLSTYQAEKAHMEWSSKEIYNQKLKSINTLTAMEQLPEDEALQAANFQTQLVQAVLHANFSEQEFEKLAQKMQPSPQPGDELVNDNDEVYGIISSLFESQTQLVEEISVVDGSLEREVDRVIQQEEHAHEIVVASQEQQRDLTSTSTVEHADSSTLNNLISVR